MHWPSKSLNQKFPQPLLRSGQIIEGISQDIANGRTVGIGENPDNPINTLTMAEMYAMPHFADANGNDAPDAGEWVSFDRNSNPLAGAGMTLGGTIVVGGSWICV